MLFGLCLFFISQPSIAVIVEQEIESHYTGANYDLWIYSSDSIEDGDTFDVLVFLDANLKFGKYIKEFVLAPENKAKKIMAIGIGHTGNYRKARRRDFIFPYDGEQADKSFGHADLFYKFLMEEVMDLLHGTKKTDVEMGEITLLGHSLSGLFASIVLLQSNNPFDHIFAYSPSLWVKKNGIINLILTDSLDSISPPCTTHYYVTYGSMERLNKISSSVKLFTTELAARKSKTIGITQIRMPKHFHNSYVQKRINIDLSSLLL